MNNSSLVDFENHSGMEANARICDAKKSLKNINSICLGMPEFADNEILGTYNDILFDTNLSQKVANDDTSDDFDDTNVLLRRAHEMNSVTSTSLSSKMDAISLKDPEWYSLPNSIMQDLERNNPVNNDLNKYGIYSQNCMSLLSSDITAQSEPENLLSGDIDVNKNMNNHSDIMVGTDFSMSQYLDKKHKSVQKLATGMPICCNISFGETSVSTFPHVSNSAIRKEDSFDSIKIPGSANDKAMQSISKPLFTALDASVAEQEYNLKRKDPRDETQESSQNSDTLFIPKFADNEYERIPRSFYSHSLSSANISIDTAQNLFPNERLSPCSRDNIKTLDMIGLKEGNNSHNLYNYDPHKKGIKQTDICVEIRSDRNSLLEKKYDRKIADIQSSSLLPPSLETSCNSGSISMRRIADKKVEFSRSTGDCKNLSNTLQNSSCNSEMNFIPDLTFTSESVSRQLGKEEFRDDSNNNVFDKLSLEESIISDQSYSDPSFKDLVIGNKPESPVTKLLGPSFKQTESFLRNLKKLEHLNDSCEFNKDQNKLEYSCDMNGLFHDYQNNEKVAGYFKHSSAAGCEAEILQLSDDEVLVEQDIYSASFLQPYVSDTTESFSELPDRTCSGKEKPYYGSKSKISKNQMRSKDEPSAYSTELHINRGLSISDTSVNKYSGVISTDNIETITEVSSIESRKKNENQKLCHEISTDISLNSRNSIDVSKSEDSRVFTEMTNGSLYKEPHFNPKGNIAKVCKLGKQLPSMVRPYTGYFPKHAYTDTSTESQEDLFKSYKTECSDHISNTSIRNLCHLINRNLGKEEISEYSNGKAEVYVEDKIFSLKESWETNSMKFSNSLQDKCYDVTLQERNPKGKSSLMKSAKFVKCVASSPVCSTDSQSIYSSISSSDVSTTSSCYGKDVATTLRSNFHSSHHIKQSSDIDTSNTDISTHNDCSSKTSLIDNLQSPLLRTLEAFSHILLEVKRKRNAASVSSNVNLSNENKKDLGDLDGRSFGLKKNDVKKVIENVSLSRTLKRIGEDNAIISPSTSYHGTTPKDSSSTCQRRDIGTNCPSPCISEKACYQPLMLQAWTQTNQQIKIPERKEPCKKIHEKLGIENRNEGVHGISESIRRPLNEESKYSKMPLVELHKNDQNKNNKKEFNSWFISIGSEEEIVPEKVDYRNRQETKCEQKSVLGLQEAFTMFKKDFVDHSNQRVQNIKDMRLQENHGNLKILHRPSVTKNHAVSHKGKRLNSRRRKSEKIDKVDKGANQWVRNGYVLRDMNEARLREKQSNRIKMKNYDLKIRQSFLKRKRTPNSRRNMYFVERH